MLQKLQNIDFRQLLRDQKLYYILVPIVCAIWPLWIAGFSLPAAQKAWEDDKENYTKIEKIVSRIHELDPERFVAAKDKDKSAAFNFSTSVAEVAKSCGIPSSDPPKVQVSARTKPKDGQQTQDADITLKQVNITTFAKFLSTMQLRWADVQCTSLKLTKQKGSPDNWKADMKLKYYF